MTVRILPKFGITLENAIANLKEHSQILSYFDVIALENAIEKHPQICPNCFESMCDQQLVYTCATCGTITPWHLGCDDKYVDSCDACFCLLIEAEEVSRKKGFATDLN